ncbi:MAG: 16S rRNA (adenine(1518)-N(6)/adenine(1519)-N(6))-dimethyltransferase RsmA [Oscillospiraceae bacterium]|nr:16S rRNA (adenine(1518)-N(6)/adenine(1519)-N(6))-dimethyltransferase RsmA [Oscillospiraceae bacterium]
MDLCSPNEIQRLLSRHGFRFSKAMGQNFLIDAAVPENIAELSGVGPGSGVLEIGPGIGVLTALLAERAGAVCAVELDKRLLPVLSETLAGLGNVKIINADIMKCDIAAVVSEYFSGLRPCVCANLPYNITTPVITRLIESALFERMTLMVQREVALRICAAPGTADYGAFSVFVQYYCEPSMLFTVPPESFMPSPKVHSAVIRLERRSSPAVSPKDEKLFFRTVRAAFALRRKTLANSLLSAFSGSLSKQELAEAIDASGISPGARGETLSLNDFSVLSDNIGVLIAKGENQCPKN